jgi:phenazine biosynthesis protein phzE
MESSQALQGMFDPSKPFFLVRRKAESSVLVLTGAGRSFDKLADIPRKTGPSGTTAEIFDTLSILPFRQVEELGFQARHDDEKILSLIVESQQVVPLDQMISWLPEDEIALESEGVYAPDDAGYAAAVARIIEREIGAGEGCNFVLPRRYRNKIKAFSTRKALACFRRLLENEYGTYWTYLYFTGDRFFIGATPERHISARKGQVRMNPISGTLRKMDYDRATALDGVNAFLRDPKETFELLMVVDEELKMMAELCREGGQVVGPLLKEMSKLIHSEYILAGSSRHDVVEMLRHSMFAATVVGSPIENACRVLYRNDPLSRRYYGSALVLLGRDAEGEDTLDSPITIRTAEIALSGELSIGVGVTIVRDSDPVAETAETVAKTGGLLAALGAKGDGNAPVYRLGGDLYNEDSLIGLAARNTRLSRFWIEDQSAGHAMPACLAGKKAVIIDNEDSFTRMLGHMIRPLGMQAEIVRFDAYDPARHAADLVVLGPGPGDPRDANDPKMGKARALCRGFLDDKQPLLCICLGHQILCGQLGINLAKKKKPFQGTQELIDLWGVKEWVGFYNAFTGIDDGVFRGCEVSRDPTTDEIHALRAPHYVGLQFHPESILTTNGFGIVRDVLVHLLGK